ncbi:hypothetical protein NHP21005_04440 [Helicobacter sp. NHP21005]|uniref:hypothetical protein n=1 Tax=Helicobacter felistomachi TaxID=3040201 RepID=UPI002572CFBD|nr:hypothetical protein [Helicobacter sp. NHP21005]BEG56756.1 hypothetical protein NHP21005_04440 [Helicobacter sp. NHP21005]
MWWGLGWYFSWDFYAPLWVSFAKVNLLDFQGGLLLQGSLLAGLWFLTRQVGQGPAKDGCVPLKR